MRIVIAYTLLMIIILALTSCSASKKNSQTKPFPLGDYRYNGYDKNASKIVEGSISISSWESNRMSGEWELKIIGNAENIGPQNGKGRFEGEMAQNNATINLNPDIADWNVILTGEIEETRFHGVWSFYTFAGEENRGTFEAVKE